MAQRRTEDRKARFLEAIGFGHTITTAATLAGITRQTAYDWQKEPTFLTQLREAEDRAMAAQEAKVLRADDWRAGLAVLERRRRDDWAKNEKVEHSGELNVRVIRE